MLPSLRDTHFDKPLFARFMIITFVYCHFIRALLYNLSAGESVLALQNMQRDIALSSRK